MPTIYQYVVIRYVPDAVRDELVNVGVLVRGVEGTPVRFKFLPRSSTVKRPLPTADGKIVRHLENRLATALASHVPLQGIGHPADPGFFEAAEREFTGGIQLTRPRAIRADTIDLALKDNYSQMVPEPGENPRPVNYQSLAPHQAREQLLSIAGVTPGGSPQ